MDPFCIDDLEPSEEWKQNLRQGVEHEREAMEAEAARQCEEDIHRVPHQRATILREHKKALMNIRVLAEEKFRTQLEQERLDRTWAAQISIEDISTSHALRVEQEAIFTNISRRVEETQIRMNSARPLQ